MPLKTTNIIINRDEIEIQIGDGTVVYKTDVNSFESDSGLTINNVDFGNELKGYYINLREISDTFICGNIIDTLAIGIKLEYDNSLLIFDFDGVEEVGNSFLESYTKFLLETSNKIITINMNISVSNSFSSFIKTNIQDTEEETEQEDEDE